MAKVYWTVPQHNEDEKYFVVIYRNEKNWTTSYSIINNRTGKTDFAEERKILYTLCKNSISQYFFYLTVEVHLYRSVPVNQDFVLAAWINGYWAPHLRYMSIHLVWRIFIMNHRGSKHNYLIIILIKSVSLFQENSNLLGTALPPSDRPSVRPSFCPFRIPCPFCTCYSSWWIISIFGTNNYYHQKMYRTQWPLALTYTFKVI